MATAASHIRVATTPSLRTILRAMAQTGGASLASGLLSMIATKIVAMILGPAQIALLSSLQQLRQTAVTGATLTGQTAVVQGASTLHGPARLEFIRTSLILMLAATVLVCVGLVKYPEWIGARAGLANDQSLMVAALVVAVVPAVGFVFLAAMMNASGAIGSLALVQLAAPATMALLAYPVARAVARGNQQLLVAILALSSLAAVLSASASLYADREKIRGWVQGPGRWWSRAAARRFFTISGSMFASGIFSSWVVLMVRGRVLRSQGLAIGGEFDAAWSISMNQAGLVLASLQTYYLPMLARTRDLEQRSAHIGKVLSVAAVAGAALIALLAASKPMVISGFYSSQFTGAARYLRWTLVGDYLKITSWILSIPLVASANMRAFLAADLSAYGVFALTAFSMARWFSAAESAAIAFVLMYAVHMIFCGAWLYYREEFRADKLVVTSWIAGLALVVVSSAAFWGASVNTPTVSVAIATYNRATMVRQGIEAALAQTLAPFEICVADDASTDETWEGLEAIARGEPRVRVFRHRKNTGGVANWNLAMAQTSGDYIAWCSDDDRFLPDHLQASVEYLEAHPEIGLVHAGFVDAIETHSGGTVIEVRPSRFGRSTVLDRRGLLRYLTRYYDWPFHPSTIVMRRVVWEQVGPFDARYALADTDWFVRAVERFPIAMLARDGVLNRRHPGNWSNRVGSAKMQREIFEIVEGAVSRMYRDQPLQREFWRLTWRMNVRLRLLLTVRARVRTGHGEAATSAWAQLWDGTALRLPRLIRHVGENWIRRQAGPRSPQFQDARQSVSPL